MSYVHCPACARAYNTSQGGCPSCVGEAAVLAAYEAFAKAIAAATPEDVGKAFARIAAKAPVVAEPPRELVVQPRRPRRSIFGLLTASR